MNAINCVFPPGPLFYRHLQMALTNTLEQSSQCYEVHVPLIQDCLKEGQQHVQVEWQDTHPEGNRSGDRFQCRYRGLLLQTQNRGTLVQTGMLNAYQLPQATSSNFSDKDIHQVQDYISILLRIDNTTAVAYVNNMGGTASKQLVILTRDQWVWCLESRSTLQQYICQVC